MIRMTYNMHQIAKRIQNSKRNLRQRSLFGNQVVKHETSILPYNMVTMGCH